MATIKKAYVTIIELLQANLGVSVEEILPQVIELASARTGAGGGKASTFHRDEAGTVVAVKCYYLNKWLHLGAEDVEFGQKASSASGLNSMCKFGMSQWTKQNNAAKKAREELLAKIASGEVAQGEIQDHLARIDQEREAILPLPGDYQGFETLEECLSDAEQNGY